MLISYHLPHVFHSGSDKLLNARTLRAMVDVLVRMNEIYLVEAPRLSIAVPSLYRSGVIYDRTTWWEPIPALYQRGYGDCKSLSAAWIAQSRLQGKPCRPVFRFVDNSDGSTDYHILVELSNGTFEDPSKVLGMGVQEVAKFYSQSVY